MYCKLRRRRLSQNFLVNRQLVQKLVRNSSIGKADLVYEIGPGKGIITQQLAKVAWKVMAVELDPKLYRQLKEKFKDTPNVELHNKDFLKFEIYSKRYKVFSNIPFAIEGEIVRKLLKNKNPPLDTYLVMRREVAERMAGIPCEGEFSVLHKPFFELSITHRFRRSDFRPKPLVESVMFRAKKRKKPLLKPSEMRNFKVFVRQGFGGGRRLRQNLRPYFNGSQLHKAARQVGFHPNTRPSDLTFEQWLRLFLHYKYYVAV